MMMLTIKFFWDTVKDIKNCGGDSGTTPCGIDGDRYPPTDGMPNDTPRPADEQPGAPPLSSANTNHTPFSTSSELPATGQYRSSFFLCQRSLFDWHRSD